MAAPSLKDATLFRQQCYVDGTWIDADDGTTVDVTNPADSSVIGTVPKLGARETRRAIEAANAAWPAWRAKTAKEREILKLFLSRPGRVFSRERILNSVWGASEDPLTNIVDVYVGRLRRKLGPQGDKLQTVRGAGYKLRGE